MTALRQLAPGSTFARDFRVGRLLAEGATGAVYLVAQLSTGQRRALKVLPPQLVASAQHRERFLREARVGAQIGSGHVVEVSAAGVDDATGIPWLAMEMLDGDDLAKLVERWGALPPSQVRDIFDQLADALGRAHAAGIVHGALAPAKLFVAAARPEAMPFTVKVLDFGLAAVVAAHDTATTRTAPLWTAPEQALQGAALRPATDVWPLGLIAFHCLTGRPYWRAANAGGEGINLAALRDEFTDAPLEAASDRARALGVAQGLPQGFDAWFARCVARAPDARFADAAQAINALLPLLGAAPAPTARSGSAAPRDAAPTGASAVFDPTPDVRGAPHRTPPRQIAAAAPAATGRAKGALAAVALGACAALAGGAYAMRGTPAADTAAPPPTVTVEPPSVVLPRAVVAPARSSCDAPRDDESFATFRARCRPDAAPHPQRTPSDETLTAVQRAQACHRLVLDEDARKACIVTALRGRATSHSELALLASAQQAAGQTADAVRTMRTYVLRDPAGPQAAAFQRYIDAH